MGSNGVENLMISGKDEANCSETTVEIKIKTLDSQTYTLRVDKCVPVPALKEQIASVTGVLSEQQRLICRGKVLKDDQLLSAYHVEDGHTLHLVVRQPLAPSSEDAPDPATDPASTSGRSQGSRGPGVVVGSFISEQDGAFPDLSRVVSAVLGSFGLASAGNGNEGIDLNELPTERLLNTPGLGILRNSSRQQAGADSRRQSIIESGASLRPTSDPAESLQPPVIPDALVTLSQNLSRLRQEFITVADEQSNSSQAGGVNARNGQNLDGILMVQRGLPTPESLADVMLTTRQVLDEQAGQCLMQLARQLQGQANMTDASERARINANAIRSGILFQNLGTLLLELGRTAMTLRMGETPADAVVNAGPAVFLSTTGPNPIMVQPLPFQPGASIGAISGGSVQQSSGLSGGSVGSGVFPRNIDIRIRTVGSFMPSTMNRRESIGSQNTGQTAPAASNHGNSVQQSAGAGAGSVNSATRDSEVRVVPIRTVIAAVPASSTRTTSDASRSAMGIIYPVLARVQHVTSGNSGSAIGPQASDQHPASAVNTGSQSVPDAAVQNQNIGVPGVNGSSSSLGEALDSQGFSAQIHSGLDQLLRTIFPGENLHGEGTNSQGMEDNSVAGNVGVAMNPYNSATTPAGTSTATDEGTFLSNLLRQIIPIISERRESHLDVLSSDAQTVEDGNRPASTQAQENNSQASSSRQRDDPPSQTSSKRQKRD